MGLHVGPLGLGQTSGLVEHFSRYGELADVVEQRSPADSFDRLTVEAEFVRDHDCMHGDGARVLCRIAVHDVDRAGEREDDLGVHQL
jgi:hypothetical protein